MMCLVDDTFREAALHNALDMVYGSFQFLGSANLLASPDVSNSRNIQFPPGRAKIQRLHCIASTNTNNKATHPLLA